MLQLSTQPSTSLPTHLGASLKPLPISRDRANDAVQAIEALGSTITLGKNSELWAQGDNIQYAYRLISGCMRLVKLMEDGRRQISEFIVAGEWVGFEGADLQDRAAEAVVGCVLRRYPRRAVESLALQNPAVARWRFDLVSKKLYIAQEHMLTLGRRTAEERIASFLLDMATRTGRDGGTVGLPMNRTDIGDYLGLRLETICRALSRFKRAGAIRVSPSAFSIRNRDALEVSASETWH